MRFATVFVVCLALVAPLSAQTIEEEGAARTPEDIEELMLHGEFAVLLLKIVWTEGPLPEPAEALEKVKELDLAPEDWKLFGFLTHGELAGVLETFGAVYVPADRNEYPTRSFVEATLRRELARLRDYLAKRMGHGFSTSHIIDEGVDRAVSPSTFR